jgi:hypothetical protein
LDVTLGETETGCSDGSRSTRSRHASSASGSEKLVEFDLGVPVAAGHTASEFVFFAALC